MENIFREAAKAIGQVTCQKLMNEVFKEVEKEAVTKKVTTTKVGGAETTEERWSRWTKVYTETFKKCLTDANVKCEDKEFDKLKKEFVKYLYDLTEQDYKKDTKSHPERMKDFADLKAPKKETETTTTTEVKKTMWEQMTTHEVPTDKPSNASTFDSKSLKELQENDFITTVEGCPDRVYWNGRDGGWVKGPDPVDDEDMVEDVNFDGKLYDVGEKSHNVYVYDPKAKRHKFAGYVGVGIFAKMKLPGK